MIYYAYIYIYWFLARIESTKPPLRAANQESGFWNSMAKVIRRCIASSRSKGRFVAKMIMPRTGEPGHAGVVLMNVVIRYDKRPMPVGMLST